MTDARSLLQLWRPARSPPDLRPPRRSGRVAHSLSKRPGCVNRYSGFYCSGGTALRGRARSDRPAGHAPAPYAVVFLIAAGLAVLAGGCGAPGAGTPGSDAARGAGSSPAAPAPLSAAQRARLPSATTLGRVPAAPRDPDPFAAERGIVLHPTAAVVVWARPGGPPVATLPARQLGGPTWVPVVQSRPGWDRVLLPARPNRATGWVYLGGGDLQVATDAYRISVSLADYRLTLTDAGRILGSWTVAVGAASTPTPAGRTFLLASAAPVHPTFSPLILPLGVHSGALASFDGGPGTVALHGWPDPAVFGHPVSHGCVRVPAPALQALARVPIGTPVMITGRPGAA
jgi:L,D-transpeptidase catalytic domain